MGLGFSVLGYESRFGRLNAESEISNSNSSTKITSPPQQTVVHNELEKYVNNCKNPLMNAV